MKKTAALFLALTMLAILVSCSRKPAAPDAVSSPDPAPEPAANTGLPVPLIAAGAVGCVALGGLIVLLIMRKHDEDESDRPSHMR